MRWWGGIAMRWWGGIAMRWWGGGGGGGESS